MDVSLSGGGSNDASEKHIHLKTYVSPWEKAMKGDESLIATLKMAMPPPVEQKELRKYKSFNRYFPQHLTLLVLCDKHGL